MIECNHMCHDTRHVFNLKCQCYMQLADDLGCVVVIETSRQKDLLLTTYESRYTSCYTLTWDPSATGISVLPANSNYTHANLVSKVDFIK